MRVRGTDLAKEKLKHVSTCDLVQELAQRDGVEMKEAGPYESMKTEVNGPAVVLTIID